MMLSTWTRRCAPLALLFLTKAALAASSVAPHAPKSVHGADIPRLFLSGPVIVLLVLSCLAIAVLIVSAFGGLEKLTAAIADSARRLGGPKSLPTLWGICVGLILFAVAAVLFATKVLAALGVIVILFALAVFGAGLVSAGIAYGRAILGAAGSLESDDHTCLRLGLWVLFFASFLPFLGWLVVVLAGAAGLGALAQAAFGRRE